MTRLKMVLANTSPCKPDQRGMQARGTAEITRRLGIVAFGACIGSVPVLAAENSSAAKWCSPVCQYERRVAARGEGQSEPAMAPILVPQPATSAIALLAAPARTLIVTTAADIVDPGDGKLSLREAIAKTNATTSLDAIEFEPSLEGKTLVLTGGPLVVSHDLVIDGDRDDDGVAVTLSGGGKQRILVTSGADTDLGLRDLKLTKGFGKDLDGGAIFVDGGSLSMSRCSIRDSVASGPYYAPPGNGGGIFAADGSRLTIIDSELIGNSANISGGAISAYGDNVDLVIRRSTLAGNGGQSIGGGAVFLRSGSFVMEDSTVTGNGTGEYGSAALSIHAANQSISRSNISGNGGLDGSAIFSTGMLTITDSTISNNRLVGELGLSGTIDAHQLVIENTSITGNTSEELGCDTCSIGGIHARSFVKISNSIVSGNCADSYGCITHDIVGRLISNGHNLFGSTVIGSVPGDRQNVRPEAIFAAIDRDTGGGKLSPAGIVPLKNSLANPALSGADPMSTGIKDQLGHGRPQPAGSLPDIGAAEIDQPLSQSPTVNNDVLTGSSAANNLSGLAGNDLLKGLDGGDVLNGGDGSDVLDGGPGDDVLNGGTGVDIVTYAGATAVTVDLTAIPAIARRGSEVDTLTSIEGAIGSSKADRFKGDAGPNWFEGGLGKDVYTGGGFPDTYIFKAVQDSPAGAGHDVIRDFTLGQDVLDLAGIDADTTIPGEQSFRWVGKAKLTGAAQLGYQVSGGNTIVRASTDADPKAELEIELTGVKNLTPADFKL